MKKAILLIGLMLTLSLAGCVGNDDSGTVQVELTDEQLDSIMDDYFQDFVNNTTVTINDETSNVYYQNGSISSQSNYYIVDHTFTKSDLVGPTVVIDYMNNTFDAIYSEYNFLTNQYVNYTYQLDCMGYYLVGIQTTPVSYWENSNNYYQAWNATYNETIADLYLNNAYDVDVRYTCDENYNPNGSQMGSNERLTILDITIPAGKGLMCENHPIIKMLDTETNSFGIAYGEYQYQGIYSNYEQYGKFNTVLSYQFDSFSHGISCTTMTLGSGSTDTIFSITAVDKYLEYNNDYRLYMVYTLVDVEDHIV
jgi:hypothetical protein